MSETADPIEEKVDQMLPEEKPKRTRTRKKNAVSVSRLDRRAQKVTATIKEATTWRLHRDTAQLSFTETVERDADQLGHAIAATAERFKPAGMLIDLLFGEAGPLSILVALAPTIRAARHTLVEKAKDRRARNAEARAEAEAATLDPDAPLPNGYFDEEAP